MIEPGDGGPARSRNQVIADQRRAGLRHYRHADTDGGVAHHVSCDGHVAEIFSPSGQDSEHGGVLDDVAGDGGIRLDSDSDACVGCRCDADRTSWQHVPDDVALNGCDTAAFVEIDDRDPDRANIDGVVGDHCALETEFGVERDLLNIADAVSGDVDIRGGVAAHPGKVTVANPVAADHDVARAKCIDGVTVLSGAAGARLDVFDTVVDNHGAIVAHDISQDLDAVVRRILNRVLRDQKPECIERGERGVRGLADGVAADFTGDVLEPDAVAAAADDVAILHVDIEATQDMHQPAAVCEFDAAAVEREIGEGNTAGTLAANQG